MSEPESTKEGASGNLLDNILTPGSTRKPEWVLALNLAFAALFGVFLGLLWITGGNKHIWVMIGIEGCLWASVKWTLNELERTPLPPSEPQDQTTDSNSVEDKKER
ncbi:hypothetical protein FRB93_012346 [Tulasnella sp. JGI-2019a]|nr:hypothetical protein FRB93_012346 [Tulasnella sp. JGI-2019a]